MKRIIVICFLFFAACVHAQQFKIEGVINEAVYGYVTLVDLSDNSVIWEGSTPNDVAKFSISAPKGKYGLSVSDGIFFSVVYLPVNLNSDIDLGLIKCSELSIWAEFLNDRSKTAYTNEEQGDVVKYTLVEFKKYDMLTVLNSFQIYDFRTKRETSHIGSVEIDGIVLKKNILELTDYFKKMPAKEVEYIETLPPSESNPGGTIRIVTSRK